MRIPKINSRDIDEVREETIKINFYVKPNMKDDSWKEDEKSLDQTIKRIERFVRTSYEYREYVSFLKEEIDMNQCAFLNAVDRKEEKGVSIEIHHAPLTLYDITAIIFNYMQINEIEPTPFEIADEVMKAHFEGLIGLVPLSLTVHELVHNSDVFIPVDRVYGDIKGFYDRYKDGFTHDHKELLKENIRVTKQLNNEKYTPAILERKYVYLEVEGMHLPKKIKADEEITA